MRGLQCNLKMQLSGSLRGRAESESDLIKRQQPGLATHAPRYGSRVVENGVPNSPKKTVGAWYHFTDHQSNVQAWLNGGLGVVISCALNDDI